MLPKRMRGAVSFARFCQSYHLDPQSVAMLLATAASAGRAGLRDCNDSASRRNKTGQFRRRTERLATELGFITDWPGPFPSFKDARGFTVIFPTL